MESFLEHALLYYIYLADYINITSLSFVLGILTALIMGLIVVMCIVGIVVFSSLILLFGIIESTAQLPSGQKRSFKKTIIAAVGFGAALLLLVLTLIGYSIVSVVLGF